MIGSDSEGTHRNGGTMRIIDRIIHRQRTSEVSDVPKFYWNIIFSRAEYGEYVRLVKKFYQEKGIKFSLSDSYIYLQEKNQKVNLQNLAQMCKAHPQVEWEALISDYLERVQLLISGNSEPAITGQAFSDIADTIAVRIYPGGTILENDPVKSIYREDIPGTAATLVLDLPDRIVTITQEMAAPWNKTPQELFQLGLNNVNRTCIPSIAEVDIEDGMHIIEIRSSNFLTATYALLLEEFPQTIGKFGTLIGIPNRYLLACYPIDDKSVIRAITRLFPVIDQLYMEGPGSISPHLYWYRNGKYSCLKCNLEKKQFFIPPDFTDLINNLAEIA
jgi:hypothetical protein